MNGTTRRAVLAVALAAAAPALTDGGEPEDPIIPIYREWLAARIEWRSYSDLPGNGNWEFPESKASAAHEYAAFDRLVEMTPTSMAGLAALTHMLWDTIGPCSIRGSEGYLEECEGTEAKLMLAIWRGASGLAGNPDDLEWRA